MADPQALSTLFGATFSADANVRMQAELQLKNLESHEGVLGALLQLVASDAVDGSVRQAAAIYLKNRINKAWDTPEGNDKTTPISATDRQTLKQNILPVLLNCSSTAQTNAKVQAQVKAAFDTMVRADFPESWPGLAESVVASAQQAHNEQTGGALTALGVLLNAHRYKGKDDRAVSNALVEQSFPHLVQLGSSLLASTPLDQAPPHVGLLLHLIFKCYRYTMQRELSPHQRSQQSIVAWGTLFLQVVNRQLPRELGQSDEDDWATLEWWKAKKWAYALLNMLFARYGCPSQLMKGQQDEYAAFARTFESSFAPEILKAYMRQVELYISKQVYLTPRLRRHIIDFFHECIKPKSMWLQLKPHIPAIVEQFIFPIYCLSDTEIEQFTDEPHEYIREHMSETMDNYFALPITAAEQFMEELVHKRATTLTEVLQFISGVVQKYPAERSAKDKDAVLRMIASIAKSVVASKSFGKHLESFVTAFVVPEFRSQHGFLRARACEVVNKLEEHDMNWDDVPQLEGMLQSCLGLLTDPELPVRVAAALALPELSRYDQVRTILAPSIGRVMQDVLSTSNEVEIDRLTEATRTLFSSFTDELMPFAVQLSSQLASTYLRLITEVVTANKDADRNDFDESKSLSAMATLRALEQLLESVEDLPDHLAQIEAQVLPAILYTLQNEVHIVYDEVFAILDSFLFYQKKISPAMWQVFELLYASYKEEGLDYIEAMMPVWDNFISYGGQHIVSNPTYLEALTAVVETTMTSPRLGAEDRCEACKIAESMFLNLRGACDAVLPRLLQHALQFIFRDESDYDTEPVVSQRLYLNSLELVINAIYYNPVLAIQHLSQHNVASAVLHKWLKDVGKFTRVHDRKLGIMAIIALLQNAAQLPPEVTQAAPSLIAAAIALFEGLPAAIQNRQKAENLALDSDDSDDGEVEGEDGDVGPENEDADDEDLEGDEIDEDLIMALLKDKIRDARGNTLSNGADDDEDGFSEEEMWEEEVLFTSPLDNVDAYVMFSHALLAVQRDTPAMLSQLDAKQQATTQEVMRIATEGGEGTLKKKAPVTNVTIPGP